MARDPLLFDLPEFVVDNKFHAGNGSDGKHYWLTPPACSSIRSTSPRSQQLECAAIGKRINARGGMAAMQEAYYAAKRQNLAASVIAAYWHGIGDWQW